MAWFDRPAASILSTSSSRRRLSTTASSCVTRSESVAPELAAPAPGAASASRSDSAGAVHSGIPENRCA